MGDVRPRILVGVATAKTWHKLKGENQLPKVIQGVTLKIGVEVSNTPAQNAV